MNRYAPLFVLFVGLFCLAQTLSGKSMPISWDTPVTISSDADISLNGSLVFAYNIGPAGTSPVTVNGVMFSAWEFPADGSLTPVTSGDLKLSANFYSANNFGSSSAPFSDLSSSYQSLLTTGGYSGIPQSMVVYLNNLTPTQQYEIEIWVSNAAGKTGIAQTGIGGLNNVTLDSTSNSVGQFVLGTFTAEYTTGGFAMGTADGSMPLINAIQLRAVPEPATWTLLGLGLLIPLAMRRYNRP